MVINKLFFWSQMTLLLVLGAVFIFPSFADSNTALEAGDEAPELDDTVDPYYKLRKTPDSNFSPIDRARLRKALTDFARNNDPEHIKITNQRQLMRRSLKQRFVRCNNDLDDSLDRQEVTACLPQIARHFNAVDINEDNVITFDELELAQAKWIERVRASEAKLEAQRIKAVEAEIKKKAEQPKESQQAGTIEQHPS